MALEIKNITKVVQGVTHIKPRPLTLRKGHFNVLLGETGLGQDLSDQDDGRAGPDRLRSGPHGWARTSPADHPKAQNQPRAPVLRELPAYDVFDNIASPAEGGRHGQIRDRTAAWKRPPTSCNCARCCTAARMSLSGGQQQRRPGPCDCQRKPRRVPGRAAGQPRLQTARRTARAVARTLCRSRCRGGLCHLGARRSAAFGRRNRPDGGWLCHPVRPHRRHLPRPENIAHCRTRVLRPADQPRPHHQTRRMACTSATSGGPVAGEADMASRMATISWPCARTTCCPMRTTAPTWS